MGKKIDQSVMDAALNKIATATTLVYCSAEPANYAGIAAVALVSKTVTGTLTLSAGTGNNRKVTVPAQTGMVATAGAPTNCTYAVLHDGTTLLAGTTVATFSITSGQTYNGNAINFEINSVPA